MWWLPHGKTKHLALTGPFRGQVAEAGHFQSVAKKPIDGSFKEMGREELRRSWSCVVWVEASLASPRAGLPPTPAISTGAGGSWGTESLMRSYDVGELAPST